MKIFTTLLTTLALSGAALAYGVQEQDEAAKKTPTDAEIVAAQLPSYPTDKCLVSDEPLGSMGEPIDFVHEGRLLRLCCKGCLKGVKEDPAKYIAKVDALVVAAQQPSYPLKTCAISGEPLGSMGEPIDLVLGTKLVRLCCKGCLKTAKKDPAKVLATVDAAWISAQLPTYPLTTCIVSGKPVEGGVDYLYGTTLTRFCCKRCLAAFQKEPQKFLPKLAEAKQGAGAKATGSRG